jgi:hypothetical protein
MADRQCATHGDASSVAVCQSCDQRLCESCWRRTVDGAPWCDPCVALLRRPLPWLVSLAGAAVGMLLVVAVTWTRIADLDLRLAGSAGGAALVALVTWRLIRRAGQRRRDREVLDRPTGAAVPGRGHPYRGALRRAGRRVAPPISGLAAAVVVGAALVVAATLAPLAMARPLWIEIEIVLAIWWALLSVALTVLLHRGARLARDL